jgi:peptidoglycan/LPS O-acetylase OafA/YrhL
MLDRLRPGAFRFFLALVVLINHSCRIDLGDWAVYSFFTLSGYWIQRMWNQKYSSSTSPFLIFLVSRVFRLLPVFWVANLLSSVVQHYVDPSFLDPGVRGWPTLAAAASNIFILGYANLPHSQGALHAAWSLDVELQFYAVFAFAMLVLSRGGKKGFTEAIIAAACVAGLISFLIQPTQAARYLVYYGIFFFVGAMAERRDWIPSAPWAIASLGIVATLVILCMWEPGLRYLIENTKHGATEVELHHKRIFQISLALLSAPFALKTVRNRSGPTDRKVSELTYVVYLVQWPVMTLHSFYFVHLPPIQRIPSVLAAWVVVGLLSWLCFCLLDRPMEAARKRWVSAHAVT